MKNVRRVFILLMSLVITSSCDKPNVLTEFSKTDSDEALYLEAKKKIDSSDWDDAIVILTTTISADFRTQEKVKETLMHAYGGKCGISFFDLIDKLKSVTSPKMFEFALHIFAQRTVNVSACDNAVSVLFELGETAPERSRAQNLFGAILGLTRMGTTLHAKLDTESSGLGNGSVDAAATNLCSNSPATHFLSDADLDRIITGVGLIFENLALLGDELTSGSASGAFADAKAFCEAPITIPAIPASPSSYDPSLAGATWTDLNLPASPTYQDLGLPPEISQPIQCFTTKSANVTPVMRRVFRRMISSTVLGYNHCNLASNTIRFKPPMPNTFPIPPGDPPPQVEIAANCCPGLVAP